MKKGRMDFAPSLYRFTMHIPIYQVDAFASRIFHGNPAAVCPLEAWLPDVRMQQIACENNLSETAFFVLHENPLRIRWFTPTVEVDLCGHATLASGHVLAKHLGYKENPIRFDSRSGPISVQVNDTDYTLDFPADKIEKLPLNHPITAFFSNPAEAAYKGRSDYLLVFPNETDIRQIQVAFHELARFDGRGVIVTSPANSVDFVSRCFYPQSGVNEDPATGSAQTTLATFWHARTGKDHFVTNQVSARGGMFSLHIKGDRVFITGGAHTFMSGICTI